MNNKALENFLEKIDGDNSKETKGDIVAVDSLIRPRKDKLVQIIGDLYDFKLNEITGYIELNNKPISGNFLRTFYLELAEKNNLDIKETNAIAWAKAAMGSDAVTAIETSIAAQITESKTPTATAGVPW